MLLTLILLNSKIYQDIWYMHQKEIFRNYNHHCNLCKHHIMDLQKVQNINFLLQNPLCKNRHFNYIYIFYQINLSFSTIQDLTLFLCHHSILHMMDNVSRQLNSIISYKYYLGKFHRLMFRYYTFLLQYRFSCKQVV